MSEEIKTQEQIQEEFENKIDAIFSGDAYTEDLESAESVLSVDQYHDLLTFEQIVSDKFKAGDPQASTLMLVLTSVITGINCATRENQIAKIIEEIGRIDVELSKKGEDI